MNGKIWNEAMIREELKRIDKKLGLHLNDLPIRFGKARSYLGQFGLDVDRNPGYFYFSELYFHDTNFPDEEKLDTIRHEAAHAVDWLYYGNMGHGVTWKACCKLVGANPQRCLNPERVRYFREKHEKKEIESEMCDVFEHGMEIKHPKFGVGIVCGIEGEEEKRTLNIEFPNVGMKKMSAVWVFSNCSFV